MRVASALKASRSPAGEFLVRVDDLERPREELGPPRRRGRRVRPRPGGGWRRARDGVAEGDQARADVGALRLAAGLQEQRHRGSVRDAQELLDQPVATVIERGAAVAACPIALPLVGRAAGVAMRRDQASPHRTRRPGTTAHHQQVSPQCASVRRVRRGPGTSFERAARPAHFDERAVPTPGARLARHETAQRHAADGAVTGERGRRGVEPALLGLDERGPRDRRQGGGATDPVAVHEPPEEHRSAILDLLAREPGIAIHRLLEAGDRGVGRLAPLARLGDLGEHPVPRRAREHAPAALARPGARGRDPRRAVGAVAFDQAVPFGRLRTARANEAPHFAEALAPARPGQFVPGVERLAPVGRRSRDPQARAPRSVRCDPIPRSRSDEPGRPPCGCGSGAPPALSVGSRTARAIRRTGSRARSTGPGPTRRTGSGGTRASCARAGARSRSPRPPRRLAVRARRSPPRRRAPRSARSRP